MVLLIIGMLSVVYVNFTHAQMPDAFITKRTRTEKVTSEHVHYLAQIFSNQKIKEAYNTTDDESFTNVAAQLSIINNQWQQYGYGLFIVFDQQTSDLIGLVGFHTVIIDESGTVDCFNSGNSAELEIYALLMPNYWRKGYGSEVSTKLIELAFNYLHYTSIIAYIEPKNYASLQFIKKLHFSEEKRVIYNNKPHILYRLHKQLKD